MKRYLTFLVCAGTVLSQNQIPFASVAATGNSLSALEVCAAAGASGTAYSCSTATTFVPAAGSQILFKPDVASGASPTLNVNASTAAPLHKQGVALVANDLITSQGYYLLTFDGVNWNMTGPGNAQFISYGSTATDSATLGPELTTAATTSAGWTGTFPTFSSVATNTTVLAYSPTISSGSLYQVVVTVSGYSSGSISITFAGSTLSSMSSNSTQTIGPRAYSTAGVSIIPSSFVGSVSISVKVIFPITNYSIQTKDSVGASSYLLVNSLGSLHNIFEGGGGTYNTTGASNTAQGNAALRSNTTGSLNTAQGQGALQNNTTGSQNTAEGAYALQNNTTGFTNTAQGTYALQNNTTGNYNSAQGQGALQNNTVGGDNSAQGANSLQSNTTGSNNVGQGSNALYSNTTGTNNTAQGSSALQQNVTGVNNTGQGRSALQRTTGSYNSAQGSFALQSNTSGSYNVSVGYSSGYVSASSNYNSITDSQMLFIGALSSRDNAIPNTTSLLNGACIGYDCKVAANNSIELGNRITVSTITTGTLSAPAINAPSIVSGPLATPGSPALTTVGAAGSTSYSYVIVARGYSGGPYSAASAPSMITTGNAVLSAANYNALTWFGSQNARCYDIYRTATGGTPSSTGLIASCQVSPYNDVGAAGDGTLAPTSGNVLGIQTKVTTFPYVPACNASSEGTHLSVSDSTTQTWGATYSGGGSLHAGIYCDSANWTVEISNPSSAPAAPSVSISGTGCSLGSPSGTNVAGLIPVTGSGSACTVTLTWPNSFAYPNHSLCGPLQDRTSGTMATQASDTGTTATFRAIALTAGDTLQYGTCTGY